MDLLDQLSAAAAERSARDDHPAADVVIGLARGREAETWTSDELARHLERCSSCTRQLDAALADEHVSPTELYVCLRHLDDDDFPRRRALDHAERCEGCGDMLGALQAKTSAPPTPAPWRGLRQALVPTTLGSDDEPSPPRPSVIATLRPSRPRPGPLTRVEVEVVHNRVDRGQLVLEIEVDRPGVSRAGACLDLAGAVVELGTAPLRDGRARFQLDVDDDIVRCRVALHTLIVWLEV